MELYLQQNANKVDAVAKEKEAGLKQKENRQALKVHEKVVFIQPSVFIDSFIIHIWVLIHSLCQQNFESKSVTFRLPLRQTRLHQIQTKWSIQIWWRLRKKKRLRQSVILERHLENLPILSQLISTMTLTMILNCRWDKRHKILSRKLGQSAQNPR